MYVIWADEDMQFVELASSQAGLGQHAFDGEFDESSGVSLEDFAGGHDFLSARITAIALIFFLIPLFTRQADLFGIDDDDVIAEVFVGSVLRLVLAAQDGHYAGGQSAEDHALCIDDIPLRGYLPFVEKPCFITALFHFPEDL